MFDFSLWLKIWHWLENSDIGDCEIFENKVLVEFSDCGVKFSQVTSE